MYTTVTLEISSDNPTLMEGIHALAKQLVSMYKDQVDYGEVRIAYQNQAQINQDAEVEAEAETWEPAE